MRLFGISLEASSSESNPLPYRQRDAIRDPRRELLVGYSRGLPTGLFRTTVGFEASALN